MSWKTAYRSLLLRESQSLRTSGVRSGDDGAARHRHPEHLSRRRRTPEEDTALAAFLPSGCGRP